MEEKDKKKISKFLSLVLRHKPEEIDLILDQNGWTRVDELIKKCNQHKVNLTLPILKEVVETNDKKRFTFDSTGQKIRANQGHSIEVDLNYSPITPPLQLYHGTGQKFVGSILKQGLLKGDRHHVHLSDNLETATKVGSRKGQPVIFKVDSEQMSKDGFVFYKSDNNVWLTEAIPPQYLSFNS